MPNIRSHKELRVYQSALDAAMVVFEASRSFPSDERFSLTDQVRRSSRSVCANIAEAWRKRRYPAHFVSKLTDAESEAAETRVWIEIAERCRYVSNDWAAQMDTTYDGILAQLVRMSSAPIDWTIRDAAPEWPMEDAEQ